MQAAAELAGCECVGIAATGSGAELLCERAAAGGLELLALEDIPAIAQGAAVLAPQARTVLEIGGQNARFVTHLGEGRVPEFSMNEGCASGTGSFFEDQMARLGMSIEDFSDVVSRAPVPRISGRCAVFAKTDIIHRQQEGAPVEDILLGLCYAMARSFKALIVRGAKVEKPVALSGGVLLNQGFVRAVRAVFGLAGDELLVTKDNLYIQAAGAAVAAREGAGLRLEDLADALSGAGASGEVPRLSPLPDEGYVAGLGYDLLSREQWETGVDGLLDVTLGVDVGSTSTDLVLLDQRGRIVDAQYLRTRGDASAAVREGLASLGTRLGSSVRVRAVCRRARTRPGGEAHRRRCRARRDHGPGPRCGRGRSGRRHGVRDWWPGLQVREPCVWGGRRLPDEQGVRGGHRLLCRGAGGAPGHPDRYLRPVGTLE